MANHKRSQAAVFGGFGRACDELFDELLGRWRGGAAGPSAPIAAVDRGDHYEVQIAAGVPDPCALDVEVTESSLRVRVPAGALPQAEHRVDFSRPVDRERTSARWADGVLTITLPKQSGRRVKIE